MNFKKNLVSFVVSFASSVTKRRKISVAKDGLVKINLGCGLQCLPGWYNVDGSLTSLMGSQRYTLINRVLYRLAGSSAYYSFFDFSSLGIVTRLAANGQLVTESS